MLNELGGIALSRIQENRGLEKAIMVEKGGEAHIFLDVNSRCDQ
jgi:hypothetical protein